MSHGPEPLPPLPGGDHLPRLAETAHVSLQDRRRSFYLQAARGDPEEAMLREAGAPLRQIYLRRIKRGVPETLQKVRKSLGEFGKEIAKETAGIDLLKKFKKENQLNRHLPFSYKVKDRIRHVTEFARRIFVPTIDHYQRNYFLEDPFGSILTEVFSNAAILLIAAGFAGGVAGALGISSIILGFGIFLGAGMAIRLSFDAAVHSVYYLAPKISHAVKKLFGKK